MASDEPRVGPYRILDLLGRGGMGAVYRARHDGTGQDYALKVIRGSEAGPQFVARFKREAEVTASLGSHPNVIRIHTAGTAEDGSPYYVMELVDGARDLQDLVDERGAMEPRRAAAALQAIADAVAFAHDNGVLHRDLKPANILIDGEGRPILTDFGLAKTLDARTQLTRTGDVLGTPHYMAPEQAAGETDKIGPHTDVFALGAILYHLLTGARPFGAGGSSMALLKQIMFDEPAPIQEAAPDTPPQLAAIVRQAMAKDPAERYSTARQLAEDLGRFLKGGAVRAKRPGWRRRRRLLGGVLLLLFVVTGAIWLSGQPGDRNGTKVGERDSGKRKEDRSGGDEKPEEIREEKPAEPRPGWHGEPMPDGMRRSKIANEYVWEPDGRIMVYVPGGTFQMGAKTTGMEEEDRLGDAKPRHEVYVSPFYMDKHEVTCRDFARHLGNDGTTRAELKGSVVREWVTETKKDGSQSVDLASRPGRVDWRNPGPGFPPLRARSRHPVVHVTWKEAQKYAEAHGKRLPTEAEWEWAARGPENRVFPWGNGIRYAAGGNVRQNRDFPYTAPVGRFPDAASWCGVEDLVGNVSEFCRDYYDPEFYARSPVVDPWNSSRSERVVVRGTHWWDSNVVSFRSALRKKYSVDYAGPDVGFRCVVEALPKPHTGWFGERMPEGMERTEVHPEYRWTKDGAIMVYVPGGTFRMGGSLEHPDEKPVHEVTLDPFYLDKFEVTIARFARYVEATGIKTRAEEAGVSKVSRLVPGDGEPERTSEDVSGASWREPGYPLQNREKHPVVHLTWEEAKNYALFHGKKLPTEAQWEWAARGPEERSFPWGTFVFKAEAANSKSDDRFNYTAPVGQSPDGAAWCGALDMAGNVDEYCRDYYAMDFYERSGRKNPVNLTPADGVVVRGGNWTDNVFNHLRGAARGSVGVTETSNRVGFRCIVPAPDQNEEKAK